MPVRCTDTGAGNPVGLGWLIVMLVETVSTGGCSPMIGGTMLKLLPGNPALKVSTYTPERSVSQCQSTEIHT